MFQQRLGVHIFSTSVDGLWSSRTKHADIYAALNSSFRIFARILRDEPIADRSVDIGILDSLARQIPAGDSRQPRLRSHHDGRLSLRPTALAHHPSRPLDRGTSGCPEYDQGAARTSARELERE